MTNQILLVVAGAFFGSYLTYVFQKRSWLYKLRIEAFAKLIEVLHQQRDKASSYAFSTGISQQKKISRIQQEFTPVWTQYYLVSFLLSEPGRLEVRNTLAGFESRLKNLGNHPFPTSNEFLGFHHEVDRMLPFLQIETTSTWLGKAIWYSQVAKSRANFEKWMKEEFPKMSESLLSDLNASLRAAQTTTNASKPRS